MNKSRTTVRFYIYAIALTPVILLLGTGIILLKYHTGASPESLVMGFDAHFWFSFHKLLALVTIPLILLHLFVKTDWVKRFFTFKVKGTFKVLNIVLFIVFTLCMLTALLAGLFFSDTETGHVLGGIHNKLGLLLILTFIIHVWNYRKVIVNQFKKH